MNLCACMYPGCAKEGRCLAASSCDGIPAEQLPIYWNCRAALTAYHNAGDGQIANPAGTIAAPAVEPEPVAWLHEEGFKAITDDEKDGWIQSGRSGVVSGYTMPLYTHPPRRPLTDEQIEALAAHHGDHMADPRGAAFIFNADRDGEYTMLAFARAILATAEGKP